MRATFTANQQRQVRAAERRASELVTRFYAIAPREWERMRYEVRTLEQLQPAEVLDSALAHVLLYGVERSVENRVVSEHDLFRICVQDHMILRRSAEDVVALRALLLFVLTHELVHVVRFGQRMQSVDLAPELRPVEEESVDRTARLILRTADEPGVGRVLERFATGVH
jgi:hypothetical protein